MSTGRKLPPHKAWDAVEKMALEEEAERVAALGDEELDAELRREGLDPKAVRVRGEALAARLKAKAPAPVVPLPVAASARRRWVVLLAAAAIAIVPLAIFVPMVVLPIVRGGDIGPDRDASPSPQQRAAWMRRDALRACAELRWTECERGLDEAKPLDPAGENRQDVREARQSIDEALRPPMLYPPDAHGDRKPWTP
jgi:hypothetical protein